MVKLHNQSILKPFAMRHILWALMKSKHTSSVLALIHLSLINFVYLQTQHGFFLFFGAYY